MPPSGSITRYAPNTVYYSSACYQLTAPNPPVIYVTATSNNAGATISSVVVEYTPYNTGLQTSPPLVLKGSLWVGPIVAAPWKWASLPPGTLSVNLPWDVVVTDSAGGQATFTPTPNQPISEQIPAAGGC